MPRTADGGWVLDDRELDEPIYTEDGPKPTKDRGEDSDLTEADLDMLYEPLDRLTHATVQYEERKRAHTKSKRLARMRRRR